MFWFPGEEAVALSLLRDPHRAVGPPRGSYCGGAGHPAQDGQNVRQVLEHVADRQVQPPAGPACPDDVPTGTGAGARGTGGRQGQAVRHVDRGSREEPPGESHQRTNDSKRSSGKWSYRPFRTW
jgi:hypothetical protein